MYKGFALAVLLVAPLLVMLTETITPKHPTPAAPPVAAAATGPQGANDAPITPPAPTVTPMQDTSLSAGAPMAEAGQPMLDLGGTPRTAPAPAPTPLPGSAGEADQSPPGAALTAEWQQRLR